MTHDKNYWDGRPSIPDELYDHLRGVGFWVAQIINDLDERKYQRCACDGVVYKIDDRKLQRALGCTKYAPRGQIARKFLETPGAYVQISDIRNIKGKTGKITPGAYFPPVEICGKRVGRVSLGSLEAMEWRGYDVGTTLFVELRGGCTPVINHDKSEHNAVGCWF